MSLFCCTAVPEFRKCKFIVFFAWSKPHCGHFHAVISVAHFTHRIAVFLLATVYISLFYNAVPDNVFYFDINASVDCNNTALVHQYLDDIIADLQAKKVTDKELNRLKQIFLVNKRNYLQNDATSGWKTYLVGQLKNNESMTDLENYEQILFDITPEDVRDNFRKLVNTDNHIILSIGDFNP